MRVIWIPPDDGSSSDSSIGGEGIDNFNAGVAFFEDQRYEEAIGSFDQALAAGFVSAEMYNFWGRSDQNIGNLEGSIENFTKAIELDGENFWYWFNRGRGRFELGNIQDAIEDLSVSVEKGADNWHVFSKLGEAYYESGEHDFKEEAHAALDQAIEMAPEQSDPYRLRAMVKLWRFDNPEGALEDVNIAVDNAEPDDPAALQLRGFIYLTIEEFELCISNNNTALEIDPEHTWSYMIRGDCFAALGDVDMARADYEVFVNMAEGQEEYADAKPRIERWFSEN